MVVGSSLQAQTEYISAFFPASLSATKSDQFESGYGSTNSTSDDSTEYQRIHTAKHRERTLTPTMNCSRSKSVLRSTQQSSSMDRDLIENYHQLTTKNSRISIDILRFQKVESNQKVREILENI